jgi:D-3-phosphoglycerate dehydrogenase
VPNPFRVLIADKMSPKAAEVLSASSSVEVVNRAGITPEELAAEIGEYHGLLVRSRTKVTSDIIGVATNLKIIGRAGIGVDNIDLKAASRRGIVVENAPSGNSVTTAEHALALLMSVARNTPQATASMKSGKWEKSKLGGVELFGKTLGLVGLGNIGRIVADRAAGLKMKVVAYDPFIGADAAERIGVELVSLDDLFGRADFISCHTPLTAETKGIIGADAFAKMKPSVRIVNASRGGVVDEDALLTALDAGQVAGAALDVYVKEPVPADHPLVAHPKIICTPHLGASTGEAQEKVAAEVAGQLVDYAERGEVRNAVNIASVSGEVLAKLEPWLALCTKVGSLVAQLARTDDCGFIDELTVEVSGEPADLSTAACTRSTLVGLLGIFMDHPINDVNATIIASDRELDVNEVKKSRDRDLASAVAVTARCGDIKRYVKGSLYHVGNRVEPRIVQIDDFLVEMEPKGRILAVYNEDRPGVIGAMGTLLGENEINVNSLHVGCDPERKVAIALWNTDQEIPEDVLETARALAMVQSAQVIEL